MLTSNSRLSLSNAVAESSAPFEVAASALSVPPNTFSMIFSGFPWDVPSYDFFNLRVGAASDNLRIVAYVENLFDKKYFTNAYRKAFAGGMFIEPSFRTYGVRVTYKFGQ